jgi:hypothetical protein
LSLVLPVVVRFSLVIYPPFGGDINLNADIPDPNQTVAGNTALSVNVTDQQADFWKRWLEERHCVEHIFDRLKDIPNFESGVHNDGNTTKCTGGNDGNTTTCMGGNDGNTTTYMGSSTDVDVEAGEAQAQVQGQSSDNYIEVANAGLWDNCPICLVDFDCTIEDAMSSAVAAPESSAVDDDGNVVHPGLDPQQHQLVVNFPCRGKHLFHVKVGFVLRTILSACCCFLSYMYMSRIPFALTINRTLAEPNVTYLFSLSVCVCATSYHK